MFSSSSEHLRTFHFFPLNQHILLRFPVKCFNPNGRKSNFIPQGSTHTPSSLSLTPFYNSLGLRAKIYRILNFTQTHTPPLMLDLHPTPHYHIYILTVSFPLLFSFPSVSSRARKPIVWAVCLSACRLKHRV